MHRRTPPALGGIIVIIIATGMLPATADTRRGATMALVRGFG